MSSLESVKRCRKCRRSKEDTEFALRGADGSRHTLCKACKRRYNTSWYAENADSHKVSVRKNNLAATKKAREVVDDLKRNPCKDCGRSFPPYAMDWDHKSHKVANVSLMVGQGRSISAILTEIAKCDLVCACCHRIRTHTRQHASDPIGRELAF